MAYKAHDSADGEADASALKALHATLQIGDQRRNAGDDNQDKQLDQHGSVSSILKSVTSLFSPGRNFDFLGNRLLKNLLREIRPRENDPPRTAFRHL